MQELCQMQFIECGLWAVSYGYWQAGRLRVPVAVTSAYSSETKPAACSSSSEQRVSILCRFFSPDVGHVESAFISMSGPSVFVNKINVYMKESVV